MARRFYLTEDGAQELSIDGTFETGSMEGAYDYEKAVIVLAGYDSSGEIVTPTAGTATVSYSPINGQWLEASIIDLTEIGNDATYDLSEISGPINNVKVTFASAAGVGLDHFIAFAWRN